MACESSVDDFTKDEAAEWLRELGLAVSGTRDELIKRIRKYMRYPKLINKLKLKASRHFSFPSSLNPNSIPPVTAKWEVDDALWPTVTQKTFLSYSSQKREGSQGQEEKAFRML